MGFVSSRKSRLLVGDFHLSGYLTNIGAAWNQTMLDTTVLTDDAKTAIIGEDTSTSKVSGYYDVAEFSDSASWKAASAQPLTIAPQGFALGSELWMQNALMTEFNSSAARNGVVAFDMAAQTDGFTDFGVSLHDLTAETADATGTAVDQTAATSNGGAAHLHVTAFSGMTSAVVIVEDSANNSTWATIGTFTTATGVTAERITIAGTIRRYVRCSVDVTGTGSVTFQVGLARR